MNTKAKKTVVDHGAPIGEACRWIGEALFGDPNNVLNEIAALGDQAEARKRQSAARTSAPPSPYAARTAAVRPAPARRPAPEVVDAEIVEDEDG